MHLLLGIAIAALQNPPDVKIAPDRSLTPAAYVDLGLPAPEHEWSSKDYAAAIDLLKKIADKDPSSLPRRGNPQFARVLSRICADENLNLCRNANLPLDKRLPLVMELMQPVKEMLLLYMRSSGAGPYFDSEMLDLSEFTLRTAVVTFDLAVEFRKTLPDDDPKKEIREKGFETMRKGLATQMQGVLQTLNEREVHRLQELVRFAAALKEHVPKLSVHLPPLSQKELPLSLKTMIAEERSAAMKQALEDLLKALPETRADK